MTQLFSHTDAPEPAAAPPVAPEEAPERDEEHAYAVPGAPPAPPADAPPLPLFAGTYAVYGDGDGGAVLVLAQHDGEVINKHIPASMLKVAERFGGGGLMGMFGGR